MESDHRYYTRRAAEEERRATRAITPAARDRHRELAEMFHRKAEQRPQPELQAAIRG